MRSYSTWRDRVRCRKTYVAPRPVRNYCPANRIPRAQSALCSLCIRLPDMEVSLSASYRYVQVIFCFDIGVPRRAPSLVWETCQDASPAKEPPAPAEPAESSAELHHHEIPRFEIDKQVLGIGGSKKVKFHDVGSTSTWLIRRSFVTFCIPC